jgi:HD-GYP domain-containing protein (c-di-GMP phosphodiesterase class II)
VSETQVLLSKIAALRQRLEQAQGLATDAGSAAASLLETQAPAADPVCGLERKVAAGAQQNALIETSLRALTSAPGDGHALPTQLTARAGRVLKQCRDLVGQLRALADEPLLQDAAHPLSAYYRDTAAMTDTVLRTVQAFPEAPSAQIRLCEGLEVILHTVADRLAAVHGGLNQRRRDADRFETLADLISGLTAGRPSGDGKPFLALAEAVFEDAKQALPLRFFECDAHKPARFAAAHCLNVAQVIARLTRQDLEWRNRPLEPIVAALVHDAGMAHVPVEVLAHPEGLTDEQRRLVEAHTAAGAEIATRLFPNQAYLCDAASAHHERLDGTGYPAGLRDQQVRPLVRLLAVCDVYCALCVARPWRPALDTRTALTDTLLMAENGVLDRQLAERLLQLSFYPPGSVVELADGALALVVATHQMRRELNLPARPVLALLTDSQGHAYTVPRHLDLAECDGRSIVRSLRAAERREALGKRYPEWI